MLSEDHIWMIWQMLFNIFIATSHWVPIYKQPTGKPCYLIVYLFSGRKRQRDYHDAVTKVADCKNFEVRVISLDTAVHKTIGIRKTLPTVPPEIPASWSRTGTRFALQVAWLMVAMLCYGRAYYDGRSILVFPCDPDRGSIFRTPVFQLLRSNRRAALWRRKFSSGANHRP